MKQPIVEIPVLTDAQVKALISYRPRTADHLRAHAAALLILESAQLLTALRLCRHSTSPELLWDINEKGAAVTSVTSRTWIGGANRRSDLISWSISKEPKRAAILLG
jgi:hypothetical protein